jgi:hypothetical protein
MINLSCFRPFLQVGFWLSAIFVLLNGLLQSMDAWPAGRWLNKAVSGPNYVEDARQRVSNAFQEYQEGRVSTDDSLCAIIGTSNVREGIDLKTVAESAGVSCRYLGLAGSGLSMLEVTQLAEPLLASQLRPDLVILGVGRYQLGDTRPEPDWLHEGGLAHLRRGDFRYVAFALWKRIWISFRRPAVSMATATALADARADMFRYFQVHVKQSQESHRSPWRTIQRWKFPEHIPEAALRQEEQLFADLGVCELATYTRAPKAFPALIDLIKRFRAEKAVVVVLLLPEHSWLRQGIPPATRQVVDDLLRQAFPEDPPLLLDFRDALDDSGMCDLTHPNGKGRERCSRLLGAAIRHYLPLHPPLMKAVVVSR